MSPGLSHAGKGAEKTVRWVLGYAVICLGVIAALVAAGVGLMALTFVSGHREGEHEPTGGEPPTVRST